jgi:hypothetical protein
MKMDQKGNADIRRAEGLGAATVVPGPHCGVVDVLQRRLRAVEERMDALWPYARACVDYELWFVLFRRRTNLSLAIYERRGA